MNESSKSSNTVLIVVLVVVVIGIASLCVCGLLGLAWFFVRDVQQDAKPPQPIQQAAPVEPERLEPERPEPGTPEPDGRAAPNQPSAPPR